MNKIDVINNFKTKYINNMKLYSDYNDSLFNVIEFNSWKNNLINRSKSIREMFIENEKIISEIKEVINDLDDESANLLFDTIKFFNKENIHDASIMIEIIDKLISYYESKDELDYDKLIMLNTIGALEEMEFFLRMDSNTNIVNPKDKYLKVLSYKKNYDKIKTIDGRRGIFLAYYNLIGPLADLLPSERENVIKYYKEVKNFYYSDIVQDKDDDIDILSDEMIYINDTFLSNFSYYIDSPLRDEYFKLIDEMDKSDLEKNQIECINLAVKYINKKIDLEEMIESLTKLFFHYIGKGLKYNGRDSNLNKFCNASDIADVIFNLLKNNPYDEAKKYTLLPKIGYALFNYIDSVPYKDYTSFFDDLCADLFEKLLPFCVTTKYKDELLTMLILRRQPITYIHSIMVNKISVAIAQSILMTNRDLFNDLIELGYDNDDKIIEYISNASFYHDLGKCLTLGVINLQNRRLTNTEFQFIKMHPAKSIVLLGNDESYKEYYDVMLGHHKTYDGKGGYPLEFDNLNSKYKSAIDLISISDSIDAATDVLGRNYANGKNFYSLLDELKNESGTRYNPFMVECISNDNSLMEYLDQLTGEKRAEVYYDVYVKILNNLNK